MKPGPGIHWRDLHLKLGSRHLVRGLNGEIKPGEFLAISGPSGSGKTTLLQVFAGLLTPIGGSLSWINPEGGAYVPGPSSIGFVYQHLRLAKQLSALQTVCSGRLARLTPWESLFGFSKSLSGEAFAELSGLGLQDHCHSKVGRLSGGERQRVAFARTLFQQPDIYFVDEPVANLDRANAQRLLARLHRESSQEGRTVVAVLHDETQINLFADRVLRWDAKEECGWSIETIRSSREGSKP